MKAIAWTKYGEPEVLIPREFERPTPKNNEVLIKICTSSVTSGDARLRAFKIPIGFWLPTRIVFGLTKPRKQIAGMELSGEIEQIGKDVTLFKKGDTVYGTAGMKFGANAEYICLSENAALVRKPENVSHEQAVACIFGGLTALHFLKDKVNVQKGQKVLINGASGAVGTASIQLANYLDAEVTGVCSTSNIEFIKSLGAEKAIDYTQEDFCKNNQAYDVILDTVGNLSLSRCRDSLSESGKLILINSDLLTNIVSLIQSKVICGVAGESKGALDFLRKLIEAGNMNPVIDRTYRLEQTPEAHRYVDTGRKKGNVVITVTH